MYGMIPTVFNMYTYMQGTEWVKGFFSGNTLSNFFFFGLC